MDYLGAREAVRTSSRVGSGEWGPGTIGKGWISKRVGPLRPCPSIPAGAVGGAPGSCYGRCTLCPSPQTELPQQCLGKRGKMGSPLGTMGPISPQPCVPVTEPSWALTSPCQAVLRPSRNRALQLRMKTGTIVHSIASFYRWESRSKRGK